jgi:hypothetical protein
LEVEREEERKRNMGKEWKRWKRERRKERSSYGVVERELMREVLVHARIRNCRPLGMGKGERAPRSEAGTGKLCADWLHVGSGVERYEKVR